MPEARSKREETEMEDILFENIHKPVGSYPYIQFDNENMDYMAHYHAELEVVYLERGSVEAMSGSRSFTLNEGDICFFLPGEIHSYSTLSPNNLYVLKIEVDSSRELFNIERVRLLSNVLRPGEPSYDIFRSLIFRMKEENEQRGVGYSFEIRACADQIVASLLRSLPYDFCDPTRGVRILDRINRYLEENHGGKITLDSAAEACNFSKFYFAHEFHDLTGMTFMRYLNDFRLEKGMERLRLTDDSVTTVALSCGFGNVRSFNRSFKERNRMTPLEYRRQFRSIAEMPGKS